MSKLVAPMTPKVKGNFEGITLKGTKNIYEEPYALRGHREIEDTITKRKHTKGHGITNGHQEDSSS
jgi:hypothetical protein